MSYTILMLIVARALREIKYYQSAVMDESYLISKKRFQMLVKEISHNIKQELQNDYAGVGASNTDRWAGDYHWESDALIALQLMTEHILIMVMGMMYSFFFAIIDTRNKLAIHAKRKTIQPKDMQLLRDLWKQIDPESSIGHPDF